MKGREPAPRKTGARANSASVGGFYGWRALRCSYRLRCWLRWFLGGRGMRGISGGSRKDFVIVARNQSFEGWLRTEVKNQGDFEMRCAKVVECLRGAVWVQLSSSFELEEYDGFDDHVRLERTNASPSKIHGDRNLGLNAQACVLQRNEHRLGINRLEKSGPQLAMHLKKRCLKSFRLGRHVEVANSFESPWYSADSADSAANDAEPSLPRKPVR